MIQASVDAIVAKTGRSRDEAIAELAKPIRKGRLVHPQEVADAVLWLTSPAASAVTGQSIVVAGGEVM
jgi:hypothetical protein